MNPDAATPLELVLDTSRRAGPIDLTRYALGQGLFYPGTPGIEAHVPQLAQLHPQTIRLFVAECFELYPQRGQYHWVTLDKVIETIRAIGARPLMCLCFKPPALYPRLDQKIVQPADYREWEELVAQLVRHCNQERGYGIKYWEIGNEVDIGEDGGCPYLFTPEEYNVYYTHTAQAILRADPQALVGGPALAGHQSPIGDALIEHCGSGKAPLHFFSWHIYHNDPQRVRQTIRDIKAKLGKYPGLKDTETILDEWNMSLLAPILAPAFQPGLILENTHIFYREGLSRAAYYQIKDFYVERNMFAASPQGLAFMEHWWNVMPQYSGLYDHHGRVRPAYFAFKLLSLIKGERLDVGGTNSAVKAFASRDGRWTNMLFWNFPAAGEAQSFAVTLRLPAVQKGNFHLVGLNADSAVNHLEVLRYGDLGELSRNPLLVALDPYAIRWVELTE